MKTKVDAQKAHRPQNGTEAKMKKNTMCMRKQIELFRGLFLGAILFLGAFVCITSNNQSIEQQIAEELDLPPTDILIFDKAVFEESDIVGFQCIGRDDFGIAVISGGKKSDLVSMKTSRKLVQRGTDIWMSEIFIDGQTYRVFVNLNQNLKTIKIKNKGEEKIYRVERTPALIPTIIDFGHSEYAFFDGAGTMLE